MLKKDRWDKYSGLRLIELENCLARSVHESNKNSVKEFLEKRGIGNSKGDLIATEASGFEVAMLASPEYEFFHDANRGKAVCDVFAYRVSFCPKTQNHQCELIIKKLEIETIYKNGTMVVDRIDKQVIQSMEAWKLTKVPSLEQLIAYSKSELMFKTDSSIRAIEIRNLHNAFFHRRLKNCEELFADNGTVAIRIEPLGNETIAGKEMIQQQMKKWLDEEAADNGLYKFIGITSASVIEIKGDQTSGESKSMVEVFRLEKSLKDDSSNDSYEVVHCLCHMHATYHLEEDKWKILTIDMNTIFELPREPYHFGYRYDHMTGEPSEWYESTCLKAIHDSQDVYEIENIIHKWGYYCRCGKLLDFYSESMKNSEISSKMYFKSQGKKSEPSLTEKDIIMRLSGMDIRFTPLMYSYHTATTPLIHLDDASESAIGLWYDRSATNLLSEAKGKDRIPYMALLTKYIHYFKKISGKWYLVDFFAEPLISFQDWYLNPFESEGFVGKKDATSLPNPYLI